MKITLEEWGKLNYGNNAPDIRTLRRWAHDSKIYPHPEKHGRCYFVEATAIYITESKGRHSAPIIKKTTERPSLLMDRLINGQVTQ